MGKWYALALLLWGAFCVADCRKEIVRAIPGVLESNDEKIRIVEKFIGSIVHRRIQDYHDAEDVTQEVLLVLGTRKSPPSHPIQWLRTIIRHKVSDYYFDRSLQKRDYRRTYLWREDLPSTFPWADEVELRVLVGLFPLPLRRTLELKMEGHSMREITVILNRSLGMVFRSFQEMKHVMKHVWEQKQGAE